MIIIYEDEQYGVGKTITEAINDWEECYKSLPNLESVSIIFGVEMKATIELKQVVKPAIKKQTVKKPTTKEK